MAEDSNNIDDIDDLLDEKLNKAYERVKEWVSDINRPAELKSTIALAKGLTSENASEKTIEDHRTKKEAGEKAEVELPAAEKKALNAHEEIIKDVQSATTPIEWDDEGSGETNKVDAKPIYRYGGNIQSIDSIKSSMEQEQNKEPQFPTTGNPNHLLDELIEGIEPGNTELGRRFRDIIDPDFPGPEFTLYHDPEKAKRALWLLYEKDCFVIEDAYDIARVYGERMGDPLKATLSGGLKRDPLEVKKLVEHYLPIWTEAWKIVKKMKESPLSSHSLPKVP